MKPELLPGDCLLYRPTGIFGWAIALKTWALCSHVEVYRGGGVSVASRDGIGVNPYALRLEGLGWVRRPVAPVDMESANNWFERKARGQKYDWKGILCFTLAVRRGDRDRQFCSEFATRFYRHAGIMPFALDWDADKVAPAQFLQSPAFETVWRHHG